jgi:hypothetical protein
MKKSIITITILLLIIALSIMASISIQGKNNQTLPEGVTQNLKNKNTLRYCCSKCNYCDIKTSKCPTHKCDLIKEGMFFCESCMRTEEKLCTCKKCKKTMKRMEHKKKNEKHSVM